MVIVILRYGPSLTIICLYRNSSAPRLASSSKDGTVRVWSTLTRLTEYTLGGHTASVNVVRWGGGGLDGKGVLYTASSDRTVRIWDATGVFVVSVTMRSLLNEFLIPREDCCTH